LTDLSRNFNRALRHINKKLENAVVAWVVDVNKDVIRVTPKDSGDMRSTQYIKTDRHSNGITVETGFRTPYAPFVHEWPQTVNWTTPGTGNKFLQRPYFNRASTLAKFLSSKARI